MTAAASSIEKTRSIELVKPLFLRYIQHMRQFHTIDDEQLWKRNAFKYFDSYRDDPTRHTYVLSQYDNLIGFALVNDYFKFIDNGHAMAEFYIDAGHQRKGHGSQLAQHVFLSHPGIWEVRVAAGNGPAQQFWTRVISKLDGGSGELQTRSNNDYDGIGLVFTI